MKREFKKREVYPSSDTCSAIDKGKMKHFEGEEGGAGIDELFEVLGYKLKSSEMAAMVNKMEQIEVAMGNAAAGDGFFKISDMEDIVHHNPSDLSSWVEFLLSGLNPLSQFDSSSVDLDFGSDLIAIPGKAVFPGPPPAKKAKAPPCFGNFSPRSILIDSQENGVRLVHTLMACAEAVNQEDFKLAEVLVKNVGFLAVSQTGAMKKVATYFAEALARRIYGLYPMNHHLHDSALNDMLQMHFYEACPYLKFAHFTANQAILEAFAGKKHVHVIDFSMKQGMQWPPLLKALALRNGGPPTFRLTGIGTSSPDNTDYLQEVGFRLAEFAKTIDVQFEYRGLEANSLADLDATLLDIRNGETVAVNSILELHQLLAKPGDIDKILQVINDVKPEIFTVVEQEANHNVNVFFERFTEALHCYSTLFDSLENCDHLESKMMSEVYLGKQIFNIVACEGVDRIERHESLTSWRKRFTSVGFRPVHLGSNVYKQATMLLAVFNGDGYSVEENGGCLTLGWHTRPLIATSAWKMSV